MDILADSRCSALHSTILRCLLHFYFDETSLRFMTLKLPLVNVLAQRILNHYRPDGGLWSCGTVNCFCHTRTAEDLTQSSVGGDEGQDVVIESSEAEESYSAKEHCSPKNRETLTEIGEVEEPQNAKESTAEEEMLQGSAQLPTTVPHQSLIDKEASCTDEHLDVSGALEGLPRCQSPSYVESSTPGLSCQVRDAVDVGSADVGVPLSEDYTLAGDVKLDCQALAYALQPSPHHSPCFSPETSPAHSHGYSEPSSPVSFVTPSSCTYSQPASPTVSSLLPACGKEEEGDGEAFAQPVPCTQRQQSHCDSGSPQSLNKDEALQTSSEPNVPCGSSLRGEEQACTAISSVAETMSTPIMKSTNKSSFMCAASSGSSVDKVQEGTTIASVPNSTLSTTRSLSNVSSKANSKCAVAYSTTSVDWPMDFMGEGTLSPPRERRGRVFGAGLSKVAQSASPVHVSEGTTSSSWHSSRTQLSPLNIPEGGPLTSPVPVMQMPPSSPPQMSRSPLQLQNEPLDMLLPEQNFVLHCQLPQDGQQQGLLSANAALSRQGDDSPVSGCATPATLDHTLEHADGNNGSRSSVSKALRGIDIEMALLERLAQLQDCVPVLASQLVVQSLVAQLSVRPQSLAGIRAERVLMHIVSNASCLQRFIEDRCVFIVDQLRCDSLYCPSNVRECFGSAAHNTNVASDCALSSECLRKCEVGRRTCQQLIKVCQGAYGRGMLAHWLLRREHNQSMSEGTLLALPMVIKYVIDADLVGLVGL